MRPALQAHEVMNPVIHEPCSESPTLLGFVRNPIWTRLIKLCVCHHIISPCWSDADLATDKGGPRSMTS